MGWIGKAFLQFLCISLVLRQIIYYTVTAQCRIYLLESTQSQVFRQVKILCIKKKNMIIFVLSMQSSIYSIYCIMQQEYLDKIWSVFF